MKQAQDFLYHVQHSAAKIGLHLNVDKIEIHEFIQKQETVLKSVSNKNIEKADSVEYLRAWIENIEK